MSLCNACASSNKPTSRGCDICGHRCAQARRVRKLDPEFVRDGGYESDVEVVCGTCIAEVLYLNMSLANKEKWRTRNKEMSK